MLHIDIPTQDDIQHLVEGRDPASVTIYLPTSPIASDNDTARIELKNLTAQAVEQLREAGVDKTEIEEIEEELFDLIDDALFWSYTSHSLAIFATPRALRTFRVPNRLSAAVEVSDRFFIKPLLRTVTFPQSAFVLALAQNSVRLVEVTADSPAFTVDVPELPDSAADVANKASIAGRSPSGRIQGSEGQKVRLRQYSRGVDSALRSVLTGRSLPLIIAGSEPLTSIYRSVNTYSLLAQEVIPGNPDTKSDADLAAQARPILDSLYAAALVENRELFESRASAGRTALDLGDIARSATFGAVEAIFVDIDHSVPGYVDEQTGTVTYDDSDDASNYGVVDEIVRRVLLSRGRVFAVRAEDVPGGGAAAAILRYAD